jgi:hypothetical protein
MPYKLATGLNDRYGNVMCTSKHQNQNLVAVIGMNVLRDSFV